MKLLNTNTIEIKKSKFIAYLYEIDNQNEVKEIINVLKNEHKKARHVVFAYKLENTAGKSDDKEPSGTAGLPLYNLLERNNATNKMVAVVRYFGGTKLGAGPLMRAYSNAGSSVLNHKKTDFKVCFILPYLLFHQLF